VKVCISPGTLSTGGIGRNTVTLANRLSDDGHRVTVVILGRETSERALGLHSSVEIHRIASRARYGLVGLVVFLRKEKPDIIISARNNINALMIVAHQLAGLKRSTRLVCTYRTHRSAHLESASITARFHDWISFALLRKDHDLVAVSRSVAEDIEKSARLQEGRVKVIYNPAWSAALESGLDHAPDDPWLCNKDQKVVIAVGRLSREKNYPFLLSAFREVHRRTGARLLILGEGDKRAEIEALISDFGIADVVRLCGFVENPLAYMKKSDLFVLASSWEGFGNVVVEALGCGLPVVATRSKGGVSEILDDGRYGRLVDIGDVTEFTEAIVESLRSPVSADILKARAREFSAERSAARYLELAR